MGSFFKFITSLLTLFLDFFLALWYTLVYMDTTLN